MPTYGTNRTKKPSSAPDWKAHEKAVADVKKEEAKKEAERRKRLAAEAKASREAAAKTKADAPEAMAQSMEPKPQAKGGAK